MGTTGRPGRTLLLMSVIAIAAILALLAMADRYGEALGPAATRLAPDGGVQGATVSTPSDPRRATGADEALDRLDAFLAVRAEVREALDAAGEATPGERLAVLIRVRTRAIDAAGMTEVEYARIRDGWRSWRAGEPAPSPALAAALAARLKVMADADLGALEDLDP